MKIFEIVPEQIVGKSFASFAQLLPSDDSLYLTFQTADQPPVSGDTETLGCYSSLKGVGCVFPFHADGHRAAYTLKDSTLEPVVSSRSNFSRNTGNVLAGPTHGCTVKVSKLRILLQEGAAVLNDYRFQTVEELGPILSLLGLRRSLRSVCVGKAKTDQILQDVRVPEILLPKIDPYL